MRICEAKQPSQRNMPHHAGRQDTAQGLIEPSSSNIRHLAKSARLN
jgi:hypothetical protein